MIPNQNLPRKRTWRLTVSQKLDINKMYKNGATYNDIIRKYKCGDGTVNRWIDSDILYRSINKIRKPRTGKQHKKHNPHKRGYKHKTHKAPLKGPERKKHVHSKERKDKYEKLKKIMIELYKEHKSLSKVKKALEKDFNVKLSTVSIARRIPKELKQGRRKLSKLV